MKVTHVLYIAIFLLCIARSCSNLKMIHLLSGNCMNIHAHLLSTSIAGQHVALFLPCTATCCLEEVFSLSTYKALFRIQRHLFTLIAQLLLMLAQLCSLDGLTRNTGKRIKSIKTRADVSFLANKSSEMGCIKQYVYFLNKLLKMIMTYCFCLVPYGGGYCALYAMWNPMLFKRKSPLEIWSIADTEAQLTIVVL